MKVYRLPQNEAYNSILANRGTMFVLYPLTINTKLLYIYTSIFHDEGVWAIRHEDLE